LGGRCVVGGICWKLDSSLLLDYLGAQRVFHCRSIFDGLFHLLQQECQGPCGCFGCEHTMVSAFPLAGSHMSRWAWEWSCRAGSCWLLVLDVVSCVRSIFSRLVVCQGGRRGTLLRWLRECAYYSMIVDDMLACW